MPRRPPRALAGPLSRLPTPQPPPRAQWDALVGDLQRAMREMAAIAAQPQLQPQP